MPDQDNYCESNVFGAVLFRIGTSHGRELVTLLQTQQADGSVEAALTTASLEGTSVEADVITQLQAKNAFLASLAVFMTSDKMAVRISGVKQPFKTGFA